MTGTWKDAMATVLVAGVVIAYIGHLTVGGLPFLESLHIEHPDPASLTPAPTALGADVEV